MDNDTTGTIISNDNDLPATSRTFTLTLSKKRTDMEWVSKIVAKLKELPLGASLRIVGKGQKQQFRPQSLVETIAGDPSLTVLDPPLRGHKDRYRGVELDEWGREFYQKETRRYFLPLPQRCVLSMDDNHAEESAKDPGNGDAYLLSHFDDRSLLQMLEADTPHPAPMCVVSRAQLDPRGREGVVQLTKSNVLTVEHYQYWRGYSDVVDMYLHPLDGLLLTVCFGGGAAWKTEQTTSSCQSKLDVAFILAMWRLLRLEKIEREYLAECPCLRTIADSTGGSKTHWHGDLKGYAQGEYTHPTETILEGIGMFQDQWMCRACPFDPTVVTNSWAPTSAKESELLAEWVANTGVYSQCMFLADKDLMWKPLLCALVKEERAHLLRCALEVLSKQPGWDEELPVDDWDYQKFLEVDHCRTLELCLTHPLLKHLATPENLDRVVRCSNGKRRRLLIEHGADPMLGLPDLGCTKADLLSLAKAQVFGTENPTVAHNPLWQAALINDWPGYGTAAICGVSWPREVDYACFSADRLCATCTKLPDGRHVLVGGEYEDYYDPDFCIYSDVIVFEAGFTRPPWYKRGLPWRTPTIYLYPREVFPPTDGHTAVYVPRRTGQQDQLGWIYILGCNGYSDDRDPSMTPIYRLDCNTFAMEGPGNNDDLRRCSREGPGRFYFGYEGDSTSSYDDGERTIRLEFRSSHIVLPLHNGGNGRAASTEEEGATDSPTEAEKKGPQYRYGMINGWAELNVDTLQWTMQVETKDKDKGM